MLGSTDVALFLDSTIAYVHYDYAMYYDPSGFNVTVVYCAANGVHGQHMGYTTSVSDYNTNKNGSRSRSYVQFC